MGNAHPTRKSIIIHRHIVIKLISRSIITLTLLLSFTPHVKPISVSENDNFYVQAITDDEEKLGTANKLLQEGYELFKQSTKESWLQALEKWQQALPLY